MIIPGVDIETSRSANRITQIYESVFSAVGVHPNSGVNWTDGSFFELKQMATDAKAVAIGEIGLDYYRDTCPKEIQKKILLHQLDLAAELELPVIIHFRQAADDIIEILGRWHEKLVKTSSKLSKHPGVLHSFSGNLAMAQEMSAHQFKIGISGPVTFKNAKILQEVIVDMPLNSFLLETDSPYLSPHPFRGQRNEPTNVRIVAEKVAELKSMTVEHVAEITTQEAERLFSLGGSH